MPFVFEIAQGGMPGQRGSQIFTGSGVPSISLGIDQDLYIDVSTGDYYSKVGGIWIFIGHVVAGAHILTGAGTPSNLIGVDGDLYISTTTTNFFQKISGSWVLKGTFDTVLSVNGKVGVVVLNIDDVSPLTVKGDIIVFNGTNSVRLPVGANGNILTADSTQANGIKWAPSATSGTVTNVSATGPLSVTNPTTTPNISITQSSTSVNGYLSAANFTIFNNKQSALTFGNLTDAGTDGITITGGTGAVIGAGTSISQHVADAAHNGYLSSNDWSTFNSKLDASRGNYILNPDAEVDTSGWNLYNDSGRVVPAFVVAQDITYTAVAAGNAGNGINVDYIFHATQSYLTPLVTVVSPTHITVAWYNGPTLANNPTATQLKAAWDAVPGAVALATAAITGVAGNRQYETGSNILGNGGDVSPVDGTGGAVAGVTFTRTLVNPIVGLASFDLGKDAANREGQGVSTDFTVNALDKGVPLQISFAYSGSAGMVLGASSDVRVFIYDITNAVLIPVTPLATLKGPVSTIKTFVGKFTSSSTSSSYRLILHIATTNAVAWDLELDNFMLNNTINATIATQVPSLVLLAQPISGAVTDHMVVMWRDSATQWVPATIAGAALPVFGDDQTQLGFATNIVGSVADIYIRGYMDGFSFGPFLGYEQYIDNTAGGISPLPSPFNDMYVMVGMAISSTALNIQFDAHVGQITNGSGIPVKGGLLTATSVNDGTSDVVLSPGANGTFLVANSAVAKGLNWRTIVAGDVPTLNQNTTGSAAKLTTARTIAGNSFDGSANITFANKFIVQGTADAGLTNAQFLGALATGILKNTTTTGVLSIAAASDITGQLLTGYVVGANTAIAATDSILAAFQKAQGEINARAPTASPTFTGDVNSSTGNVLISTIGKGLQIKTGANAKIGTSVLVGGTVTVANTSVTANSRIFLTSQADGGTVGFLRITAKTAATSFVITSSSVLDTSTVAWIIVESIP